MQINKGAIMFRHFYCMIRQSGFTARFCRGALLALLSGAVIMPPAMGARLANGNFDVDKTMLESRKFVDALGKLRKVYAKDTHIVYLVLDHETLEWSAYHSKPTGKTDRPCDVTETDVNSLLGPDGNPRVFRCGGDKLVIVIKNANPFLYSYEGTVSPPQESPDATAMRTAFGAILNTISPLLRTAAVANFPLELRGFIAAKLATPEQPILDLLEMRENVQRYVRWLETGGSNKPGLPDPRKVIQTFENALKALYEIENFAQPFQPLRCYQVWLPLLRLRNLSSINNKDLETARDEMIRTRAPSDSQCKEVETRAFAALAELSQRSDDQRPIFLNSDREAQHALQTLDVDNVLSAKKDFLAAAAQIRAFARISETQWYDSEEVALVVPPFPDQNWLQDNPGTISIKPEPSVYPECPRLKPTGVDKKFLLASRRQAFLGFGLGVIPCTSIIDPTYSAGHNDEGTLVIKETSQESRSGAIVAMVFLRLRALWSTARPWLVEPGLEFGATLDTAKPGLYFGLSFEISRLVRLGVGGTYQLINELKDKKVGDPVFDASDIQTGKTGKPGVYIGITFALDTLPLFSPSK